MKEDYKKLDIYNYWKDSELHSTKGNTFFNTYDELFSKYRNKKITFVEIGVKWGGSLFMWRKFFGKKARIIGVDLYPKTKNLEKYGFEIFIGDQSSSKFWKNFFDEVGNIDILVDDGGHTNENQILTVNHVINNVNDDGIILVEDIFSSYDQKFQNPSKYSFINYSKFLIDDLNGRVTQNLKDRIIGCSKKNSLNKSIYSIKFFTNFVAFFVDRRKSIETDLFMNRDLQTRPSNFIREDFINPRRSTDIYKGNLIDKKLFKYFRTKFVFLKKIHYLNILYRLFSDFRINKKLKNYFN